MAVDFRTIAIGERWCGSGPSEDLPKVHDGSTGRSWYDRYDASDFQAATGRFDVTIGPNRLSAEGIKLDLPQSGLRGRVDFTTGFDPWPVTLRSPGIRGWYAWAPVMESRQRLPARRGGAAIVGTQLGLLRQLGLLP